LEIALKKMMKHGVLFSLVLELAQYQGDIPGSEVRKITSSILWARID
jgi:hypothetical protein